MKKKQAKKSEFLTQVLFPYHPGGPDAAGRTAPPGLVPRVFREQARLAPAHTAAPPPYFPLRKGHAVLQTGYQEQP